VKLALLLVGPFALLALVREATTTNRWDVGLILLGGVVVLGAYNASSRIKRWADRQGPAGMALGIVALFLLLGVQLLGWGLALQGLRGGW
jgi:hypothetical protein